MLLGDEQLLKFAQEYVEDKFDWMNKESTVLDFADFFNTIGIWYWNTTLSRQIQDHYKKNFHSYSVKTICRLVKLMGYNFTKSEEFFSLIEDTLTIQTNHVLQNQDFASLDIDS